MSWAQWAPFEFVVCKYTDNCNTCVDAHIRLRQPNLRRIKIIKAPTISAPETPHQKEVHLLVAHLPEQLRATPKCTT